MTLPKIRMPAVAGQFYPESAQELKNLIGSFIDKKAVKKDVIGCILPHAGYIYSGKVAAETVSNIQVKEKVILLGPNHTGEGAAYSIMTEGAWQTPLGSVKIDPVLSKQILGGSKYLEDDSAAHMREHSLEVELPFLQYFRDDFQIVPVAFMSNRLDELKGIGHEVARVISKEGLKEKTLLVASSDMTHYESQADAKAKDDQAINAILELDEDKLMERIRRLDISMCGYAPAIVLISAAKALGAKSARLIKYATSGETTGDTDSVVGYAGITVY